MTLERLRGLSERFLAPLVALGLRLGIGPHALSLLAFGTALSGGIAFTRGPAMVEWYLLGGVLVALNGILDLLDGAIARELGVASDAGDVLDHTLDRYADIVVIGGLAIGVDQLALGFLAITGVLMTSYLGTQAQAAGYGRLYAGLLGRADRLALVVLIALVMFLVPTTVYGLTLVGWLLLLFGVIGHLTAIQRFVVLWRGLT